MRDGRWPSASLSRSTGSTSTGTRFAPCRGHGRLPEMKHILLFEPYAAGHRMYYVRHLIAEVERRGGMRVLLAVSADSANHPQVTELCAAFPCVTLQPVPAPPGPLRFRGIHRFLYQRYWVRAINDLIRRLAPERKVDYVFFPFLDDACLYVGAALPRPFGGIPWGGIAVRPRHHLRASGIEAPSRWLDVLDRVAYGWLLSKPDMRHLFSIDPYFVKFEAHPKLSAIPDPADLVDR